MTHRIPFRHLGAALTALALTLAAVPATAQGLFDPAVKVGDRVVTVYELEQRTRLLEILGAPGDPAELAQQQLIEDRLKLNEAKRLGVTVEPDALTQGKEEFAARANLSTADFVKALAQAGVEEQTLDDFVRVGLAWRQVVRGRFGRFVDVTEQDIDRTLTTAPNPEALRVLLSEIFIPMPPGQEGQAQALAQQISQIQGAEAFAQAARQYSAAPSAGAGGRVAWLPVTELPPNLRTVILGLEPGQVSRPLPIPNALAIFQLRALEEAPYEPYKVSKIDYAAYYIPGGRTQAGLQRAAEVRSQVDQCDDLYGIAKDQPPSVLERGEKAPSEIPQDIAYELSKLDSNEVSTGLTRANGQTLVFLMLCKRTTERAEGADRDQVRTQLQNQEIDRYATGLLERLRAETRIIVY